MLINTLSGRKILNRLFFIGVTLAILLSVAFTSTSQENKMTTVAQAAAPLLTRTVSRHEVRRFGYGGTVTVVGAPQGSITIEGWSKNEVDITAEIELHAQSEEDLARLATVNGFALDENVTHLSLLTMGTHDKIYLRRVAKDFPKRLLGLPWKIDYRLKVPITTDLEINGGVGPINVSGVEGAISVRAPQSDAVLTLTGGIVTATIATGTIDVHVPVRSWRGGGVDIQLAAGTLNIDLPPGFNGDVDADILRSGKIDNKYPGFEERERQGLTDKIIRARAGSGGAALRFTVGDGTITFRKMIEK
jgi:hypothetical protein